MTIYPLLEDVIFAHTLLLSRFGGSSGLRDLGALEAALARPMSGYHNDVIQEAAALMESLSQNHPFVDGNKRTAITVAATFLRVNGYWLDFNDLDAYNFLIGLYESNEFRFSRLDQWLREHTRPAPESK